MYLKLKFYFFIMYIKLSTTMFGLNEMLKLILSDSVKYLVVFLDNLLSWNTHFNVLSLKLKKENGLISKLRHFVLKAILLQIYYSFFDSHLRYACQIWAQNLNCTRIFKLQKQCIRLITFSNFDSHTSPLFLNLNILKLSDLVKFLNVILVYQVLNNSAPQAIINIYNLKKHPNIHITRGFTQGLLARPQANTSKYGTNSIIYLSVLQWNEFQLYYSGSDLTTVSKSKLLNLYKSFMLNSR